MKFFVQKIFEGKNDELVHLQFQKFSRGSFKNKAMVKAKVSKGKFSISTTAEYANELVRYFAEKAGEERVNVAGVIVSTADLTGKLEFTDKKQFMGIKQYVIKSEMSGNSIVAICENFPECFLGLSFSVGEDELKIKPKAPKSAKPSTKSADEKKTIDFCKIKTSDKQLVDGLLFGAEGEFKEIEITHEFIISDVEIPQGVNNPNEMRRLAKRKGRVIRNFTIDGIKKVVEKEFIA